MFIDILTIIINSMKNSEISNYNINKAIILSAILVLTLTTSLAFSYYFNNSFTKCPRYNTGLQYDGSAILIQRIRWKKPVNIYVISTGDRASKAENVLWKLKLNVK